MLKSSIMALVIISIWSSIPVYASSFEEGPNEDVCGLNHFLNEDGECIPDRECRNISTITTDKCQPENHRNWPDPECPYGLMNGADDGCWHLEGYPIDEGHEDHRIVSESTCKNTPDHPFC
jgi:hypothetical protein